MICRHSLWEEYRKEYKSKKFQKAKTRKKTEIAIIGGGITGISNAYFLSKTGHEVMLFESHKLGSGATGASPGIFSLGMESYLKNAVENYGEETARKLWEMSIYSIKLIEEAIKTCRINCSMQKTGSLDLAAKKSHVRLLEKEYAIRRKLGFHAEFLSNEELKEEIGTSKYHAAIYSPYERTANPLQLSDGLANAAIKNGAEIYEHSAVKQIYSAAGRVFLKTEQSEIEAQKVIICTDAFTYDLGLRHDILPVTAYTLATEPLPNALMSNIFKKRKILLWDSHEFYDYFRPTDDNRLIFGSNEIFAGHHKEHEHENHFHYNEPLLNMKKSMLRIFPQLRNARITHYWKGTFGMSGNGLPIIGTSKKRHNLIYSVAHSGQGLAFSFLSGKLISDYLKTGHEHIFELFSRHKEQSRQIVSPALRHKIANMLISYKKAVERM